MLRTQGQYNDFVLIKENEVSQEYVNRGFKDMETKSRSYKIQMYSAISVSFLWGWKQEPLAELAALANILKAMEGI